MATGSRRLEILKVVRDALDAVLEGGCVLRRKDLDFSKCGPDKPLAVVGWETDSNAGATTADGGPGVGGTLLRNLTVLVDVYMTDPGREPIDANQQMPDPADPSSVERTDNALVLVEDAIEALAIESGTLATRWQALVDAHSTRLDVLGDQDGTRVLGARLTIDVSYRRAERDTTELPS